MKTLPSHTPGPWKVYESMDNRNNPHAYAIWQMLDRPFIDSPKGRRICLTTDGTTLENKANACLIAAAPDMYEALKELKKQIGIWYPGSIPKELYQATEQANAALSKARGKI